MSEGSVAHVGGFSLFDLGDDVGFLLFVQEVSVGYAFGEVVEAMLLGIFADVYEII